MELEVKVAVSFEIEVEEEVDYVYFAASFTIAYGAYGFVSSQFHTYCLDSPDHDKLWAFCAALSSGEPAYLKVARRLGAKSYINVDLDTAEFVIEHEGTMDGGVGGATVRAPRKAAVPALERFAAEWARLFPRPAGPEGV